MCISFQFLGKPMEVLEIEIIVSSGLREKTLCCAPFKSKVAILPENGFIRQKERQIIVCQEVSSEHEIGEKKVSRSFSDEL